MIKPDRSTYTPTDFLAWRDSGSLTITPKFQRRGVWSNGARSFFIDTLLREMPIPPIYLRVVQDTKRLRVTREVIDGQQRISAILDFIDGKYRLRGSLDADWKGKTFDELSTTEQKRVVGSTFTSEVFQGISDLEVLEMFARLNTYSVKLNRQELRNGRYFGHFKRAAYLLALEHLEFWRVHGIFTERSIARMLEVELTSELMIAGLAGMQDKKNSIDDFYEDFDDHFSRKQEVTGRFRTVINEISETAHDVLHQTEFRRVPLFYTLFSVVYHRLFGLPKQHLASPKRALTKIERLRLGEAIAKLSEIVRSARDDEEYPKSYETFVVACLSQTDNIRPRQERFNALYVAAFR